MTKADIWRPVDEHYEVSRTGLVRKKGGDLIGQWLNDQGYALVRLANPRRMIRVHRLVAKAFIPNPAGLPFVNHLDCNRSHNDDANLEWCTQRHNLRHAASLGRLQRADLLGKRSRNAALSDVEAEQIRRRYAAGGLSWEALGREYEISKRTIGRIVRGESYV